MAPARHLQDRCGLVLEVPRPDRRLRRQRGKATRTTPKPQLSPCLPVPAHLKRGKCYLAREVFRTLCIDYTYLST
jgi:hypothetical protein